MQNKSSSVIGTLIREFFQQHPAESARILTTFSADEACNYLKAEPVTRAAAVFSRINSDFAVVLIREMDEKFFSTLFSELDPSLASRLLSCLSKEEISTRLSLLPTAISRELRDLMQYPPETAGFIMDPRVCTFTSNDTVEDVLKRIRSIRDRRIVNIHIIDDEGRLTGSVPLQEVAVSFPNEKVGDLVHDQKPVAIQAMSPREDVVQLLEEQKLMSLPVIEMNGRLLGVIRYDALLNAAQQDATEDVQAMFGAGREERALSKAIFAVRQRLPWLEINLATAFLAAAVVGLFEETIARITVLAVFLPVVAGQSGNTGSQALAVTMRGLALREIRTRHWFRVARKEIAVGFVNGCAIAFTTSLIVFFWADSYGLALVIAAAMILSMVIAGFSGAVIPILLKAAGQDPAQSSSIILTTVTDIVGFLSFLGLASWLADILAIV